MAADRPDAAARTPLTIFISAATDEFKADRDALAEQFESYGVVQVQEDYPGPLYSGTQITEAIDRADLVICLIGYCSGRDLPTINRPADALPDSSWTQYEYDHALRRVRQHPERKRLAVFLDRGAPSGPVDERQKSFRARIYPDEKSRFDGLFFASYTGPKSLRTNVKQMIEDPRNGLAWVQYSYWLKVRNDYAAQTVAAWNRTAKYTYTTRTDARTRRRLMRFRHIPYIATRGFSILNPTGRQQLRFLTPAAFLTGRDTNTELLARKGADWRPIAPAGDLNAAGDRIVAALQQRRGDRVRLGGVELTRPIRLFMVSGSGIGKTRTLSWLQARLNGLPSHAGDPAPASPRLAILLLAGDLLGLAAPALIGVLADHLIASTGLPAEPWRREMLRVGLQRDAGEGNLVLLIDGLDHTGDLKLLKQSEDQVHGWAGCPIVAAGRPHALLGWEEARPHGAAINADNWRFIEPDEFSEHEAMVFLGSIGPISRMSVVEESLSGLLRVPRTLEYIRTLKAPEIKAARTASDIYLAALRRLVGDAMNSAATRESGPDRENGGSLPAPLEKQVQHMLMLLSALGFISLCATIDAANHNESYEHQMPINDARKERLLARIQAATRRAGMTLDDLERDLQAVAAMSSVVSNGILEDLSAPASQSLTSIMWANRTVQQFFAALWLARYAGGGDAVRAVLDGGELIATRDPAFDAQRTRHYVFFPEADISELTWGGPGCPNIVRTDTTYEFNLFLAEMPWSAIEPARWAAAVSAWYDPQLFSGEASAVRLWPTEMIYRSWQTMLRVAGRKLDDWWDTPYDRLARLPPGRLRNEVSRHRDPSYNDPVPLARLVLDRFLADFQRVLDDGAGREAARAMIAEDQWIRVPGKADFMMGRPRGVSQGCPTKKVDTYWKVELLDAVQSGRRTPEEAGEFGTWKEWFPPNAASKKGRAFDVQWLKDTLQPLADESAKSSPRQVNRNSPAYRRALRLIQARFQTADETPAENPQPVSGFDMHRLPVLHDWYGLFAPGHARAVAAYLGGLETPAALPPGDHPVTYIGWFDAWAFCQWATWRDPASGRRFGLRLPHEPEWEWAARGRLADGKPAQIPQDWRWWWGNEFYDNETSLDEEPLSLPQAHAQGAPGRTRAPEQAAPNGLGFHDILGNVWEWTATLYSERRERDTLAAEKFTLRYSRFDPLARPPVNGQRTMRGGLWYYLNILATCTNRFRYVCNTGDFKMGFRVVREQRPET